MYRLKSGPYLPASLENSRWGGRAKRRCSRLPRRGMLGKHGSALRPLEVRRCPSMLFNTTRSNNAATTQQNIRVSGEMIRAMFMMSSWTWIKKLEPWNKETKAPAERFYNAKGGGTITQPLSGVKGHGIPEGHGTDNKHVDVFIFCLILYVFRKIYELVSACKECSLKHI